MSTSEEAIKYYDEVTKPILEKARQEKLEWRRSLGVEIDKLFSIIPDLMFYEINLPLIFKTLILF